MSFSLLLLVVGVRQTPPPVAAPRTVRIRISILFFFQIFRVPDSHQGLPLLANGPSRFFFFFFPHCFHTVSSPPPPKRGSLRYRHLRLLSFFFLLLSEHFFAVRLTLSNAIPTPRSLFETTRWGTLFPPFFTPHPPVFFKTSTTRYPPPPQPFFFLFLSFEFLHRINFWLCRIFKPFLAMDILVTLYSSSCLFFPN